MQRKYLLAQTENHGELALVRDNGDGTGHVVDVGAPWEMRLLVDALRTAETARPTLRLVKLPCSPGEP